jgi:hypothetical protein
VMWEQETISSIFGPCYYRIFCSRLRYFQ